MASVSAHSWMPEGHAHAQDKGDGGGRVGRERGRSEEINDRDKRWDLKPRQSVDLVSQAWCLGPGAWAAAGKGFGSVLLSCRRAEERELPSALCAEGWSGLGCTWWMLGRVGSMLVG